MTFDMLSERPISKRSAALIWFMDGFLDWLAEQERSQQQQAGDDDGAESKETNSKGSISDNERH